MNVEYQFKIKESEYPGSLEEFRRDLRMASAYTFLDAAGLIHNDLPEPVSYLLFRGGGLFLKGKNIDAARLIEFAQLCPTMRLFGWLVGDSVMVQGSVRLECSPRQFADDMTYRHWVVRGMFLDELTIAALRTALDAFLGGKSLLASDVDIPVSQGHAELYRANVRGSRQQILTWLTNVK